MWKSQKIGNGELKDEENFDFEEAIRSIHIEIEDLNAEAVKLAQAIKKNFEELGI